jgi:hypothetical protein
MLSHFTYGLSDVIAMSLQLSVLFLVLPPRVDDLTPDPAHHCRSFSNLIAGVKLTRSVFSLAFCWILE